MIGAQLRSVRYRVLLPLVAFALAAALGGCVAYPGYPGYGYGGYGGYGYGYGPYYGGYPAGGYVEFGSGWGWRGGDRDWHEHGDEGGHRGWGDHR